MPLSVYARVGICKNKHLMDHTQTITIDPRRRGGRPCVRGTRISVHDIAGWFASGMSESEIVEDFPQLTSGNIRAAMAYLADREHRVVVSLSIAA